MGELISYFLANHAEDLGHQGLGTPRILFYLQETEIMLPPHIGMVLLFIAYIPSRVNTGTGNRTGRVVSRSGLVL